MGTLNNEKWYWKWVPLLDRYRKLKERRKAKAMAKFVHKAKHIFDMGLYGVETERVWITWGPAGKYQNRIGFDKPITLKIEDALQEIVNVGRDVEAGRLEEFDDSDMPTWNVRDIDNPEKMAEYDKAAKEWDKKQEEKRKGSKGYLRNRHKKFESREEMENSSNEHERLLKRAERDMPGLVQKGMEAVNKNWSKE